MILVITLHIFFCFLERKSRKKLSGITGLLLSVSWLYTIETPPLLTEIFTKLIYSFVLGFLLINIFYLLANTLAGHKPKIINGNLKINLTLNHILIILLEEFIWRGAIPYYIFCKFDLNYFFIILTLIIINIVFTALHGIHNIFQFIEMVLFFSIVAFIGYYDSIVCSIGMHLARNYFISVLNKTIYL
mgnify:CR=1 FL=1